MKYGDTLRQRSIPEWGHFNIDYDSLKDLIKRQTTPGIGKAVSIPGQGDPTERAFGDTFFRVLEAQHDRINLFIRSKSGEIERRLEHIGRTLAQLQARRPVEVPGSRLPAKTVERYAKIDADVTKAGEEIRYLSRFRIAQRTGFLKILKKYKRWTRDSELEHRFREEISSSPESFFRLDLGHLLDQYIDVLGALRSPFDNLGASPISAEDAKALSSASRLSRAIEEGDEVDFDLALSTTPLGSRGSKATYWIHPDHIVEVEVLLLQHLRLYIGPSVKLSPSPVDSPHATPARRKSSTTVDKYFGNEDSIGLIVLDHPESFAKKQNASTVGSSEEATGLLRAKAAGYVRWSSSSEAAVAVGLESDQASERTDIARLKRKYLEAFLDTSEVWGGSAQDGTDIQQWLAAHRDVKPIVGIYAKRTRFVGLHNSLSGGMWATLDRDIFMTDSLHRSLSGNEWFSDARIDSLEFPHAVLEVRRENSQSAALIQALDDSHLVERVRGFSLEAHAVWTCCKPVAMCAPIWISLLDKDIRKLPAPVKRQRRKAGSTAGSLSRHTSPPLISTSTSTASITDGQSSPYASRNGESSATSAPEFADPPLRAFRKKSRQPYSEYPSPIQAESAPERQHYWNEYDNPESEDDGYYIYIDPDATVKFPGQKFIEDWARRTKNLFSVRNASEESPLLSAAEYGTSEDEETADESIMVAPKSYGTIGPGRRNPPHEGYFSSLFRSLRDPHRDAEALDSMRRASERERRSLLSELLVKQHEREMTKLRFYATCLATAVVIDIILSIMTTTSRRKERGVVNSAILFGTICNLLLLAVAVLSMRTRREMLGSLHQGFVMLVVIAVVVVDMLLLRWMLCV